MKKVFCTLLLSLTLYHSSDGCSCVTVSIAQDIKISDAVFVARVLTSTIPQKQPNNNSEGYFFGGLRLIKAITSHKFKGDSGIGLADTIYITTSRNGSSCGYNFEPNNDYIIYGNWVPDSVAQLVSSHRLLHVSLCSRTQPYNKQEISGIRRAK